jgi:hypothetical protein
VTSSCQSTRRRGGSYGAARGWDEEGDEEGDEEEDEEEGEEDGRTCTESSKSFGYGW